MKPLLFAGVALVCLGGSLSTDYSKPRSLRVSISSSLDTETKSMRVERDGEPMDVGGGGMSSTNKREITYIDTTLEHKDGAPTKVRRVFEDLASESTMSFGDRQSESSMKPRLAGVTLELTQSGRDVEVKVVDGKAEDEALVGHTLPLLLDAFLPEGDETSWELDKAAIQRGLALDVQKALFAAPEPPSGGGESGRGRSRGGMMGGGSSGILSIADLEGKAERAKERVEHDGVECVAIQLEIKGSGDMPQPDFGGGGRGRLFDPAGAPVWASNTYSIELKGRLLFDPASKLPVLLELKGSMEIEQSSERTFNDVTIKSESVIGGEIEFEISITQARD